MTDQTFLTPSQAADFLGVKLSTIYKWVHMRKIPFRKHGRLLRFDRQSLIAWSNCQIIQPNLN